MPPRTRQASKLLESPDVEMSESSEGRGGLAEVIVGKSNEATSLITPPHALA